MTFQELHIIEPILQALKTKEYFEPTPIQFESIPVLLKGKDILGSAQTGTGKTAAFAIPILQNLYLEKQQGTSKRSIKALVLAPTRELALQIHDNFIEYGKNLDIRTSVIYGGVPQSKQVRVLRQGVDILIATPGRLLDLIQQRKLTLSEVSYLVLDEADRMLDMGFVKDVKKIVAMVKKERQTMFFSATMPNAIMSLANEILYKPVRIMVSPEEETIDKIEQTIYYVDKKKKINLLVELLKKKDLKSVLVFSRTKHGANRIVKHLDQFSIRAEAIHGNKSQRARQRALALFKAKQIRVLVATDIAARGIDVDELSHVINFDLPEVPETYIHRIGRTGRAGLGGYAISFCSQDEANFLKDIQKHIKMKISVVKDSVYSIELKPTSNESKNQNSGKTNKPNNHHRPSKSYSRKRTKSNKVKPKNFSKYDNRNQSRNS
jgi:ATP-dependent RNA helicase RhlE